MESKFIAGSVATGNPSLTMPLAGDFSMSGTPVALIAEGPHRFVEIGGMPGYHPTSLRTILHLATDQHLRNEGSIALWVAPLESLSLAAPRDGYLRGDRNAQEYGLLGDTLPINDPNANIFAWYWRSVWHPQMIAKFKDGAAAGGFADYEVTPYVPVEHLPLRERQWYEFFLTWNKAGSRLRIYVNGIVCGTTSYPFRTSTPRPGLYVGNTAMAFANVRVYDVELSATEIEENWARVPFPVSDQVEAEIAALHTILPKPEVDWRPGAGWALACDTPFTSKDGLEGWTQQGCLEPGFEMRERICTPEGLLLETPDEIGVESRMYLWSPQIFEGDIAVEFDFRPELQTGLALLVVQATGMQREDFIADHPLRTTGSMATIITDRVRNYHWEFFRHCVDVRGDVETQVLIKNPWLLPLGLSSGSLFPVGEWRKLLFVQEGSRLRVAIDGKWVIDACDDPNTNNGPVLNSGRIGLRLMYQTRMCFRNLKVWNRPR